MAGRDASKRSAKCRTGRSPSTRSSSRRRRVGSAIAWKTSPGGCSIVGMGSIIRKHSLTSQDPVHELRSHQLATGHDQGLSSIIAYRAGRTTGAAALGGEIGCPSFPVPASFTHPLGFSSRIPPAGCLPGSGGLRRSPQLPTTDRVRGHRRSHPPRLLLKGCKLRPIPSGSPQSPRTRWLVIARSSKRSSRRPACSRALPTRTLPGVPKRAWREAAPRPRSPSGGSDAATARRRCRKRDSGRRSRDGGGCLPFSTPVENSCKNP